MPLPQEIVSTFQDQSLANSPTVAKYNSIEEVIKGHEHAQSFLGKSIQLPDKAEEYDKWVSEQSPKLKDHGFTIAKLSEQPPASPDAYDFKLEGVAPEQIKGDKVVQAFAQWAHKNGVGNAQANALVEWYAKDLAPMLQKQIAEQSPEMIEDDAKVEALLGERFKGDLKARREEFQRGVLTLKQTIPDLEDFLEGVAPNGKAWIANKNHPAIVQLISEVARMQAQDFGGNMNGNATTADAEEAHKKAIDIMRNPDNPKYKQFWSNDKDTAAEVEKLMKQAHPGETSL